MSRVLNCADLFCGAGGTSCGAEATGGAKVRFAVNHWQPAVDTHSAYFPDAVHVNSRLDQVNPGECQRPDILFASPECTHHSRARGGKPTSDQQRSGGWDVVRWVEFHRPAWLVVENVAEWEHWGPVGDNGIPLKSKRGAFFAAWVNAIKAAGYKVDWRRLNAADYGAPTSRDRLFVIARRGHRMPVFPEPTHTRHPGGELPGMGLPRWRAASEVIDWSLPCPSIFTRKRPLAPKTLARIEAGLRKFVGPFQYQLIGMGAGRSRSPDDPLPTIVAARENHGVVLPFISIMRNNCTADGVADPLSTLTAGGGHHGLCLPFLAEVNHSGSDSRTSDPRGPIGTVSTHNGRGLAIPFLSRFHGGPDSSQRNHPPADSLPCLDTSNRYALAVPFLLHYYGTANVSPVTDPVDTITTRDRHGLALASMVQTCKELRVADVGFRMLQNHELSAAQGFPSSYVFCGNKGDVTRQIGNSVSPPVAAAITKSILGV
ncbi:MAG: DNA cytosine methyltransferase [Planctomycetota bacterium]|nr:DNA cytosine methyltransferase [Planctomycetota bacterium]